MPLPPPLPARTITLLGPTASGKTALAVALARSLDAEILSIDSRMVYRELDIGCGKDRAEYGAGPTAVPVHLLDLCGLDVEFSLFDFQLAAMDVIDRLTRRGKRALLCGGSGLYLDCLLAGYRLESAAPDAGLRDPGNPLDAGELEALYHARVAAPHNSTDTTSRERLLRAIEVAGSQSEDVPRQRGSAGHAGLVLGLRPSRELLRTRIRARLEASLARLGTDRVDHFQLHRPDPLTPPEETLGCLEELRAEGKIREIGCTHFTAEQLQQSHAAAVATGARPYASVQNHYSVLTRGPETDGVFDACRRLGVAFVPYFPLEAGLLTGKYRLGEAMPEGSRLTGWGDRAAAFIDDAKLAVVERLIEWCAGRDHTLLDLALSWHTSHPLVASVIAGATTPEQVAANVAAAQWALTPADRAEVDAILAVP